MPKLFQKRSGTWVEIRSIFQKRSGTWTEILNVFQKIGGTWTRVFSGLKIPGNTVAPTITGTGYLFSTLTNNSLGTWTNSPTAYARQWRRGNPSIGGGEPTSYSNITGATSSTYTTVSADDGKYIICQVTASNAAGSNSAASNPIYVNKYAPVSLAKYIISGNPTVGSTLTTSEVLGSTWKSTTDISGDTSPDTFFYQWQWADTGAAAYNDNNSKNYTVTAEDLGHTIAVRATATNTGGSTTSDWSNPTGIVTDQYVFSFGKTLYVGSNGYIGLDAGSNSSTTMGSGRNLSIFVKDLQQWYLAEYSTTTFYTLYFRSYLYNTISSPAARNALDYQIKFYNDPSIKYCDVYIVRRGADVTDSSLAPGYYSNGNSGHTGIQGPYFLGTGSTMRIYFDGTPATTFSIPWTLISDTVWDLIRDDRPGGLDDSFTAVVTSANQQAPVLTAPTITSVSVGTVGGAVSVSFSGGSGPFYQAYWTGGSTPTVPVTPDASGSSSPLTDSTGPVNTSTFTMFVRSVLTEGELSVGPSSLASSWSSGVTFNMNPAPVVKLSTPTGVNATDNRTDGINITWNAVSDAAYYGVWYGGAPAYDSLADFGGNRNTTLITGTSYLDTSMGSGVTRDYYVQAYKSGDPTGTKSEWGGPDSGTRAIATVAPNGGSVSVSPSSGTAGITTFTATPSGWSGTPSTFTYSYSWQYLNTSFSWQQFATGSTAIAPNVTAYAWQVVLTVSNGVSPNGTASASFSVSAPVSKLSTPTGVSASDNRTDGILISWNAVSGASYYGVWWGPVPGYDSTPDFQNISGTSYFDSGAPVGSRNYYVQAFASGNPSGTKSDWGGPDSGTRLSVPVVSAPTNLVINLSYTGSPAWTGSWSASNATSYSWSFYTADNNSGTNMTFRSSGSGTSMSYSGGGQFWGKLYVTASNSGGSINGESPWV